MIINTATVINTAAVATGQVNAAKSRADTSNRCRASRLVRLDDGRNSDAVLASQTVV